MTSVAGSTLVPSRVTTTPLTSTSPSSISSSLRRREATPASASSFCRRIRPSSSSGRSRRSVIARLALGRGGLLHGSVRGRSDHLAQLVLELVHPGQVGRQLRQVVEAGDTDPL